MENLKVYLDIPDTEELWGGTRVYGSRGYGGSEAHAGFYKEDGCKSCRTHLTESNVQTRSGE